MPESESRPPKEAALCTSSAKKTEADSTDSPILKPYATGLDHYLAADWNVVLPVDGKGSTPAGMTGYRGPMTVPTSRYEIWRRERGHHNLTLRLPRSIVGLDVDAYKDAGLSSEAEIWLKSLPPTYRSSSRFESPDYDGHSGIRLFRLPEEMIPLAEEQVWLGNVFTVIDIIRFAHRQVVCWPSVHPGRGSTYRWMRENDGKVLDPPFVPLPYDIPTLAEADARLLLKPPPEEKSRARAVVVDIGKRPTDRPRSPSWDHLTGDWCRAAQAPLDEAVDAVNSGHGRHDSIVLNSQLRLVRLAEQGHRGAEEAQEALHAFFLAEVGEDREDEWIRGMDGAVAEVESNPTAEADKGCCGAGSTVNALADIEAVLFDSTPVLSHIRQAARSQGQSPWSLLLCALARTSADIDPKVVIARSKMGPVASLNFAGALVGRSGDGKSATDSVAEQLMPLHSWHEVTAGTGEGLIQTYLRWQKADDDAGIPAGYVPADIMRAYCFVDEVAQLGALEDRNGSTFGAVLRSMMMGNPVGTTNADMTRRRYLARMSYRLGFVVGVQPELSDILLNTSDAGTPQRFVWLPALDPDAPDFDDMPEWPSTGPWGLTSLSTSYDPFTVDEGVQREVVEVKIARRRGEGDPLDAHRNLTRLKVAALLIVMHGEEHHVTRDWWDTAGLVMEASNRTRQACIDVLSAKAKAATRSRGRADTERSLGAREALADHHMPLAKKLHETVAKGDHLNAKHGPKDGCTKRCLKFALRHHAAEDREAVIELAIALGWIDVDEEGRYVTGGSAPA
jgi:hypothetical protein